MSRLSQALGVELLYRQKYRNVTHSMAMDGQQERDEAGKFAATGAAHGWKSDKGANADRGRAELTHPNHPNHQIIRYSNTAPKGNEKEGIKGGWTHSENGVGGKSDKVHASGETNEELAVHLNKFHGVK